MAERTKLCFAAAMKRLLVKKNLDKIRVTEICRRRRSSGPLNGSNGSKIKQEE